MSQNMFTESANKKPKTTTATTCKQNWFFTSPECIAKWHRLTANQWFINALNEKLSYATGNAARNKFLSLLTFHTPGDSKPLNSVQLRALHMPELDTAHMFVLARNETTLGYFSCADVWKYDERSTGGSASEYVKLLEKKGDVLIAAALSSSSSTPSDLVELEAYTSDQFSFLPPIIKLAYAMVNSDHHFFVKRLLQTPRIVEIWEKLECFNYCDADGPNLLDDGAWYIGTTLLESCCSHNAFESAKLLVHFRHQGKLVYNPFDTGRRKNSRLLSLTQETFTEDTGFCASSTSNGMSAVHVACWCANIRTLRVLLNAPVFDGQQIEESPWQHHPNVAAPINRTNDVNYGWQQNRCSAMGITPLHAILLGATKSNPQNVREGVEMLINFGADVNVVSGPVTRVSNRQNIKHLPSTYETNIIFFYFLIFLIIF